MTSTITEPAVRAEGKHDRRHLRIAAVRATDNSAGQRSCNQFRIPEPCVPVLARPRVTGLLGAAIAEHRITLVSGPAGAGKTVACAAWAAAPPAATTTAWVSLDSGDRKPATLWRDVLSALAVAGADRLMADLPAPSDQRFPQQLAERAGRLSDVLVLVLDNIGELTGTAAMTGIAQLIKHGPPELRLVLTGRHPATLPVSRLRVDGQLGEVGGADLACTPDEADRYFRMLGRDVPAAQRDELLHRTQGWITGLRLAALRAAGQPAAVVSRISGEDPAVADYLWDEVLAGLPAASREFLLRTAVTDLTCGDLAGTLTGQADGAALLDRLARDNMLVQPARTSAPDGEPGWYQYHPLMLDLLRARLDRDLPGERVPLTRRAARWQAARGRYADAVRSAARAGDWEFASRVLADAGPTMLLAGPAAELEPVLAAFPASRFADDAAVAGALAAAGLRTGDTSASALHLENAGLALHRCPPGQRERIEPWLTALRLMHGAPGHSAAVADAAMALARTAERTASGPAGHLGLGLLWCALGVTELGVAEPAAARASFAASRRHLADGEPAFAARAASWQALAEAMNGDLRTATALLDEVCAGESGDPLAQSLARLASAYVRLGRDEPAAARAALDDGGADFHPGGQQAARLLAADPLTAQVTVALTASARSRAALAEGDLTAARASLTRLRYQRLNATAGRAAQPSAPAPGRRADQALDLLLAPVEADIAVRDSDLAKARQVLATLNSGAPVIAQSTVIAKDSAVAGSAIAADDPAAGGITVAAAGAQPPTAAIALAKGRLLLAQGDSAGALRALVPCLRPVAGKAGQVTLIDQVCALVTAAVAARRLGRSDSAADDLTCALALAEPHGLYRPFLDGGPAARSALTVLIRPLSDGAAFAARILQRFEAAAAAPAGQQAASVALTSSELAVLRFLPSHMTNQEIADALFLSINTVKTHLRSVYRKLGVATRRQAITRGGKLGLL